MPWEEPPKGSRPRTPMRVDELPEATQALLLVTPRRNPVVEWEEDEKTGLVTLIYRKNLTRIERAMGKVLHAIPEIRRPLDAPGSDIWRMLDGETPIADICTEVDRRYKEEMEPVLKRVVGFVQMLAERGLVLLRREDFEN